MKHTNFPKTINDLSLYQDKKEILLQLLVQLEKDTGLEYPNHNADANQPVFLQTLRMDLAQYLKKISDNSHTRLMHLIFRVDISQAKFKNIEGGEFYYQELSELVLNRLFQKVITKRIIKT